MAKNISGDQWTHVAIAVEVDSELCVIELGPKGCVTRSLTDFRAAYRYIGFARPVTSPVCRERMLTWAKRQLGTVGAYSWLHFAVAGGASLGRRFAPAAAGRLVERVSRRAATFVDVRDPGAMLCSSFVWDGLMQACGTCRPALAWPNRARVGPWRARPSVTDVGEQPSARESTVIPDDRAARLLANPSDIWVAGGYEVRIVVDAEQVTELRDLRVGPRGRCHQSTADTPRLDGLTLAPPWPSTAPIKAAPHERSFELTS